jgi:hypothetical protein
MNRYNSRQLIRYLSLVIVMLISPVLDFHPATIPLAAISSPPGLVLAQGLSGTTIQLTWMAVAGADNYVIYRDGAFLASQPSTQYDDTSVTPATTYTYQVSAIINGVESSPSTADPVSTQAQDDTSPPTQPGTITVSSISSSSAALSWAASTDNVKVVAYRILRGPVGAPLSALVPIGTAEGIPSFTSANLRAGTAYQFAVIAIDASNNHSPVRTITFTTASSSDTEAPTAPSSGGVVAKAFSSSRIDLLWGTSSSADLSGYQIFRDGGLIAEVYLPLRRYYSDNGLTPLSTHTYQIRAIDSAGNVSPLTTSRTARTLSESVVKIARGPYIQWTTENFVLIAWWTNIPAPSVVNYGVGSLSEQVSDQVSTRQHVMLIAGLASGTTYQYQVVSGDAQSATLSFTSAASPGTTFSFAAVGDFGGGSGQESQIANNIGGSDTQFVLTLGDNVYPDSADPDFTTTYFDFDERLYKPYGTVMGKKTMWLAGGNHEYYGDEAFWENIWMPNNERWYSFDWGDAHFLVLDTELPITPGTPQYQFALADLSASQSKIWRIAVLHRPPYSSTNSANSSSPGRTYLAPMFEQQHVQLVLTGHSHNYERTYPLIRGVPQESGGVTYIVSGGGGNGLNQFLVGQPSWSAFRQASYEHVSVTVSSNSLQINAIMETGAILDSTVITADSSVTPTSLPTITVTPTYTPTATNTSNPTATSTATDTPSDTPTSTVAATNTLTPTVEPTDTSAPTADTPTTTLTDIPIATSTATPTIAPTNTPIFSDGFESGNMSSWTTSGGLTVQTALVNSGTYAARGTTTDGRTFAKKTLPASYRNGYARIYFNLVSHSSQVNLLRYRTSTDTSLVYLFINTSGKLSLQNDVSVTTLTSTTSVGSGWHALEFHVVINGTSSTTEVWLDGIRISNLSITTNLGTSLIGRLQIGEVQSATRIYDVIFDDVIFDTQRIGP